MAQFPSSSSADGIWTLRQQRRAELGDDWPVGPNPPTSIDILAVGGGGGTVGN